MKKTFLLITSLLIITSTVFAQSTVNINSLQEYGEKAFKVDDEKPYTGRVFDLYKSTGEKKLEGYYRNGIKNGKWKWWNEDGKMDSSGTYKIGIKDGKWIHSTDIGNGKYEVKYTKGNIDLATFTDNLGQTYSGIPVNEEPKADGQYLYQEHEYNFSKYPEFFATINNGEEDGMYREWHENGQKKSEGAYKDGKEDGLWTTYYWYENGQKESEVTYKDGELDGLSTYWYENGQKKEEVTYKDGEQDGLWARWHQNGQKKSEVAYKDGELYGLWTEWYENGQKAYEETFKDGELDGLWTWWYENGQKIGEMTYKDGKEDGLATRWYENGQKKWEGTYKDGERISIKCWDKDGNEEYCN